MFEGFQDHLAVGVDVDAFDVLGQFRAHLGEVIFSLQRQPRILHRFFDQLQIDAGFQAVAQGFGIRVGCLEGFAAGFQVFQFLSDFGQVDSLRNRVDQIRDLFVQFSDFFAVVGLSRQAFSNHRLNVLLPFLGALFDDIGFQDLFVHDLEYPVFQVFLEEFGLVAAEVVALLGTAATAVIGFAVGPFFFRHGFHEPLARVDADFTAFAVDHLADVQGLVKDPADEGTAEGFAAAVAQAFAVDGGGGGLDAQALFGEQMKNALHDSGFHRVRFKSGADAAGDAVNVEVGGVGNDLAAVAVVGGASGAEAEFGFGALAALDAAGHFAAVGFGFEFFDAGQPQAGFGAFVDVPVGHTQDADAVERQHVAVLGAFVFVTGEAG